MRRDVRVLLILSLLGLSGCERTANTRHQYDELRRLSSAGHRFTISYDGDLPISFTPFGVSTVGPTNDTLGSQGDLESKGSPEALQAALKAKVIAKHPTQADGQAKAIVILFHFREKSGAPCGTERHIAFLGGQNRARVTLRQIGLEGSPYSIVAEPEAIIWESAGVELEVPLQDK